MISSELKSLFSRDLERLASELEAYTEEEMIWIKVDGINNSAGNLFMHLCGNLQHFIGATLANTGYVRNREFEFNGKIHFDELKQEIQITQEVVQSYLSERSDKEMEAEYPLQHFEHPTSVSNFLMHLYGHLNYHMGQINYHRRILSETSI